MDACAAGMDAPTLVLGLKAWAEGQEGHSRQGGGGVEGGIDSCPMQRSPCHIPYNCRQHFYQCQQHWMYSEARK